MVQYRREPPAPLARFTTDQLQLLEKINRADRAHLARLRSIVVPDRWSGDELDHASLPLSLSIAVADGKALVVHLPSQVFGAYEDNNLVRWGAVSSGREAHPTPSGSFHLNWRSRERRSTDNAEWHKEWYFNFHNTRGLAFHAYSLPGRPASHACVRLLHRDARWLFRWGEGWSLTDDGQRVISYGTPVVIVGAYDFRSAPPWTAPSWWQQPIALDAESLISNRMMRPDSHVR